MAKASGTRAPVYNMPRVPVSDEVALAQEFDLAGEIELAADADPTVLLAAILLLGVLYSIKYFLVPLIKLLSPTGGSLLARVTNWIIDQLTAPVKAVLQWVVHRVVTGIEDLSRPFARTMESWAWTLHDAAWSAAHFAESATQAIARLKTTVIPRIVTAQLVPVKKRIKLLEIVRMQLDSIARQYGYSSFPVLVRTATPHIKQLVAADVYVKGQGHKSLAGALSVYEASAQSWNATQRAVKQLGYYSIPAYITHTDNIIKHQIIPEQKKQALEIGKIQKLLGLNAAGIPLLLAAMVPQAVARFFRPAIPEVCTEVGDCAATNLLGSNRWNFFKDLLGLILAATVDALLLVDLCVIAKGAQELAGIIEPELRQLVAVEGGLIGAGCANSAQVLPPPEY